MVDKDFLIKLFEIISRLNPKEFRIKIEITVHSEQEKTIYETLEDFINSRTIPREIKRLSIKENPNKNLPKSDKEKTIQFFLTLDKEEPYYNSYCQLIGYDDGKLYSTQKQIETLLDNYKNWYHFSFRSLADMEVRNIIRLIISLSVAILVYNGLDLIFTSSEISVFGCIIGFFLAIYYFGKWIDKLFPFHDFQISSTKRDDTWKNIFSLVTLGLIVNFIWQVISYLILKK